MTLILSPHTHTLKGPITVPILSGEITTTETPQVNKLHSTVDDLIDHLSFFR